MYINWAHHYIPKINGILSFVVNPLFIWISIQDTKMNLGAYRYLLCYFSMINMMCSVCDILVPMVLHDYGHAFSVFVADGFFSDNSGFNNFVIGFRCSCISATYALLHSHFLYRYMVFHKSYILNQYFMPYGLILSTLYTAFHMGFWVVVCTFLINADMERREYVRQSYMERYGKDVMEMNMLVALYSDGSADAVRNSWLGIMAITALSIASVVFLFFLRLVIVRNLNREGLEMSEKTRRLQQQLMRALTAQALIPTVVSFSPCIFAWYQPIFAVNLGRWLEDLAVIAISIFPFLDPLSVFYFVPSFRRKLLELLMWRGSSVESETAKTATSSRVQN